MKKALLISLVSVLIAPAVLFAQKEQTRTFKGIKTIRMTNASGSCRFVKSTDATVTVKLQYTYNEGDVENTMEQDGDRLTIREKYLENHVRGSANWTLTIPDGTSVKYSTGSGSVEVENLKADISATSGSGDIRITNVTGTFTGNTGSGDLELRGYKGELDINVGSGSASIENSEGDIDVNCGSGNIRINQSKAAFRLNTGSGNINGNGVSLAGASKFNSGSGDATISLATTPQHDIMVNSGSGDAELNFNGNTITGEITMEASKRHGNIRAPFEFDKTEEISRGNNDDVTVRKTASKGKATNKIRVGTGSGDAILRQ